jgi:hypothetical protein
VPELDRANRAQPQLIYQLIYQPILSRAANRRTIPA